MSLSDSAKETMERFEKMSSPSQLKQLEAVDRLFDDLVSRGLMSLPSYDIEPLSTLPARD